MPIQSAQCWFPGLAISNAKIPIFFSNKIYGSILSNSTRKLLRFEITKMLIAVEKSKIYYLIYYNFRYTFVPCRIVTLPREIFGFFDQRGTVFLRRPVSTVCARHACFSRQAEFLTHRCPTGCVVPRGFTTRIHAGSKKCCCTLKDILNARQQSFR